MLDEAEIKYLIKNEGVQDLLGLGVFGTGFNPLTGPIQIQVLPEDEVTAKEILKDVEASEEADEEADEEGEENN